MVNITLWISKGLHDELKRNKKATGIAMGKQLEITYWKAFKEFVDFIKLAEDYNKAVQPNLFKKE